MAELTISAADIASALTSNLEGFEPSLQARTVGRVAAVMLGSSETTFYTVAVYYGAAGITKTRYTIPAALCADVVMFLASAFFVRLLMGA